jgi:hypothetical protein
MQKGVWWTIKNEAYELECHWKEHRTKCDQTDILLKKICVQEHYKLRGSTIRVDQNFPTDIRKIAIGLIAKHEGHTLLLLTLLHWE